MSSKKIGQKYTKVKSLDFKGGDSMNLNKITDVFRLLVANLVSILFIRIMYCEYLCI